MTKMKLPGQFLSLLLIVLLVQTCPAQPASLQKTTPLSDYTRSFVAIDTPKIALLNAKIIDGSGSPIKTAHTVLIENGMIVDFGPNNEIRIPEDFYQMDLSGKTLIPGLVGTHNHMRLPRSAMLYTAPKLYLASGLTTIQTCGTGNPYEEIAIAKSILIGDQPGPEIVNSGPYFTGPEGKSNFIRVTDEQMIRDTIQYWAKRGVQWFKVYRNTRPQDLKVIIDAAHKNGAKVTGHLCATTYAEAAELGIDAIEHGFIHSYDFAEGKEVGSCSGKTTFRSEIDISSEAVKALQQKLIKKGVALGSTLAIFAAQARGEADPRDLELMAPFHIDAYHHRRKRKQELGKDWYFKKEWLLKSMQFDLQFYRQGGLLVAGLDPGLHNMPGFGDQKNYELFIEAGFKPEEAIQVMTSNGAKLLEKEKIGTIQKGKQANLVVLNGDLEQDPKVIRKVETVFKKGIGYDPVKLIEAVKGNVGSPNDDRMTYLGQKPPTTTPELFAPNLISKQNRNELGLIFSKNGRELFFSYDDGTNSGIYHAQLVHGVWNPPIKLFKTDFWNAQDPMLTPDEQRLYFTCDKTLDDSKYLKDSDIWYINRLADGWSNPIHVNSSINTTKNEYSISFSQSGQLFFASNREEQKAFDYNIYKTELVDNSFQNTTKLPAEINSNRYEGDVFIAPDESYIIFCAIREEGLGNSDLYISFKDENNKWTKAKNLGPTINTENHELSPFVTKDGKYLIYHSYQDIYWVSSEILKNYR